ncbi:Hypothetical protein PROPJV5_1862 [Propionibacterium ruminifibrarum]|uniref:Uncharacterized protein n=1 Tax=Propionibacterium ruminifibrarum TaxID=1962131 RepID=A0A375I531_9ACTN|nr:Hypothetical protein PROPJV5_1862 [Propionibacterium ruminifibrarum]
MLVHAPPMTFDRRMVAPDFNVIDSSGTVP